MHNQYHFVREIPIKDKCLKPDSAMQIWYCISEFQNPYAAATKIASSDDVRKYSLTICVGRAEKSFLQLIWISFPFFVSLGPPKQTFRCAWLVVKEKGNTGAMQKLRNSTWHMYQIAQWLQPETASPPNWLSYQFTPGRNSGLWFLDIEHLFVWILRHVQVWIHGERLGCLLNDQSFPLSPSSTLSSSLPALVSTIWMKSARQAFSSLFVWRLVILF